MFEIINELFDDIKLNFLTVKTFLELCEVVVPGEAVEKASHEIRHSIERRKRREIIVIICWFDWSEKSN
jgi:hypothetical protein